MQAPILSDGVISLRAPTIDDVDAHLTCEDELVQRFHSGGVSTVETTSAYFERCMGDWANDGPRRHFEICAADDGAIIGSIDVNLALESLPVGQANISYAVAAWRRGEGVAARAVELVVAWLASVHLAQVAVIRVEPDNERSLKVPLRTGFTPVGARTRPDGVTFEYFERSLT